MQPNVGGYFEAGLPNRPFLLTEEERCHCACGVYEDGQQALIALGLRLDQRRQRARDHVSVALKDELVRLQLNPHEGMTPVRTLVARAGSLSLSESTLREMRGRQVCSHEEPTGVGAASPVLSLADAGKGPIYS